MRRIRRRALLARLVLLFVLAGAARARTSRAIQQAPARFFDEYVKR